MSLPNKEILETKQEAMRLRRRKEREEQEARLANRPKCIACKRRVARVDSPYCSRCTAKGMVNQLRDTLPGMPAQPPAQLVDNRSGYPPLTHPIPPPPPLPLPVAETVPPPPAEKYYTRTEVADIIGVSNMTLIRWERKGAIPQPQRVAHNNRCVYTKEMVDMALNYKNATYTPPPPPAPPPGTPGTPAALIRTSKVAAKFDRKLEKAVARRLGSLGRLFR